MRNFLKFKLPLNLQVNNYNVPRSFQSTAMVMLPIHLKFSVSSKFQKKVFEKGQRPLGLPWFSFNSSIFHWIQIWTEFFRLCNENSLCRITSQQKKLITNFSRHEFVGHNFTFGDIIFESIPCVFGRLIKPLSILCESDWIGLLSFKHPPRLFRINSKSAAKSK